LGLKITPRRFRKKKRTDLAKLRKGRRVKGGKAITEGIKCLTRGAAGNHRGEDL